MKSGSFAAGSIQEGYSWVQIVLHPVSRHFNNIIISKFISLLKVRHVYVKDN